jgi:hypothetical protein
VEKPVDGVVFLRFGEGDLVVGPVKAVPAVTEAIRPRDQGSAVGAVAHRFLCVGLQHVAVTDAIGANAAADLDDGGVVSSLSGQD